MPLHDPYRQRADHCPVELLGEGADLDGLSPVGQALQDQASCAPIDAGSETNGVAERSSELSQEVAPILDTVLSYVERRIYPYHTPGHKGGRFVAPELSRLMSAQTISFDLPAMTATDNTLHPRGCVLEAQRLAAQLFGAGETFFLVGGASMGIAAMILAAAGPEQTIVLPRNVHRSVASALVLAGARPRFLPHPVLPSCGATCFSAADLAAALDSDATTAAVLITRPTYYGLAAELENLVAVCHQRSVPVLVDEAHGSHLPFLPSGGPQPALNGGADVVVQSCHKSLGSLVGTAMLHVHNESLVDKRRVRESLNLLQSTSPNYLLLASLDATRRHMWRHGRQLFMEAVRHAEEIKGQLSRLPGIRVLSRESHSELIGYCLDPLRVVVNVEETGWTGYEVERFLREEYQVEDEFADHFNVVLVLSPNDDAAAGVRLLSGFRDVSRHFKPINNTSALAASHFLQPPIPPLLISPREALLGRVREARLNEAIGSTIAETVTFYPPGIPLLMPGEQVTTETVEICRSLMGAGAHCYANDTSLRTVRVVDRSAADHA